MPCENFVKMGFEGSCPIKPGEYKQKIFIPVPDFKVPMFLTAVSTPFIAENSILKFKNLLSIFYSGPLEL